MSNRKKVTLAKPPCQVGKVCVYVHRLVIMHRPGLGGSVGMRAEDNAWAIPKRTVSGNDEQRMGNNCTDRAGRPTATRNRVALLHS